jgi:surfeit locus 1 family protein
VSPPGDRRDGGPAGLPGGRRSPLFLAVAGTVAVLFFVLFVALGTWQVKRRIWKLDLIARVEQRVHAPPVASPAPAQWPSVTAAADEYRHVTATGTFLDGSQTLVQAVTDLGAGYWVLTPLQSSDGSIVLVNRGFVAADDRDRVQPGALAPGAEVELPTVQPAAAEISPSTAQTAAAAIPPPTAQTAAAAIPPPAALPSAVPVATVTGLLRITEPHGGFLRHNDPAANHWYSRDVQAIAAARGLTRVAPYFIDAEAVPSDATAARPVTVTTSGTRGATGIADTSSAPDTRDAIGTPDRRGTPAAGPAVPPTPGLTVVTFHNSHLVYAITWYTLALMTAIAIRLGIRKQ